MARKKIFTVNQHHRLGGKEAKCVCCHCLKDLMGNLTAVLAVMLSNSYAARYWCSEDWVFRLICFLCLSLAWFNRSISNRENNLATSWWLCFRSPFTLTQMNKSKRLRVKAINSTTSVLLIVDFLFDVFFVWKRHRFQQCCQDVKAGLGSGGVGWCFPCVLLRWFGGL